MLKLRIGQRQSNTDQIPAAKIPGLATASGRYFAIPTTNVSGDADNYILSTGDNLGTLAHGDRFFFHPPANNNGALTIMIDSVAALTLRKSNGQGGLRDSQDNDLYANVPTIVTYDESTDNLQLGIATIGSAAYRNAGVGSGRNPHTWGLVGFSTRSGWLRPGTPGQALLRTGSGMDWGDVATYYPIAEGDVGGNSNTYNLTTGQSLTAYSHGMLVWFRVVVGNAAGVRINVDGIGVRDFVQTNVDTFVDFPSDQLTTGTSVLAVYDAANTRFVWAGGGVGAAAKRLVGTAVGNLIAVRNNGRIDDIVLNPNIARTTGATFTGAVSGNTPTADENLATKEYVDDAAGGSLSTARVFHITPANLVRAITNFR